MDQVSSVPLTDEARQALLQEVIGQDFVHQGELFLPSLTFYDQLGVTDIKIAAKQLFGWLGYKPHRLNVVFEEASVKDARTLYIPQALTNFPYLAGTRLAKEVTRVFLATKKLPQDDTFIEFSTIKLGLGLVVLNGAEQPQNHAYLHHLLNGHWHLSEHRVLMAYRPIEYAHLFEVFLKDHRISPRIWANYASPYTHSVMPELKKYQSQTAIPKLEQLHNLHAHTRLVKAVLFAIALSIVVVIALFTIAQRPYQPDKLVTDKYQTLQLLQQSYRLCQDKAGAQIKQLSQDDMFNERQVDATLSRCQSIRNNYNYEVDNYNKLVR